MPVEKHTTPLGAIVTTWVCRRCGFAYPKKDLVADLCESCLDPEDLDEDHD